MIKVFDFRCTNGHVFEDFVDSTVTTTRCACGANATKIVSATPCILDGSTADFPVAHEVGTEHEKARQSRSGIPGLESTSINNLHNLK